MIHEDERNAVARDAVRTGVAECPLCGRHLAEPTERLVAFGVTEPLTVDTADAVECPRCDGVTFLVGE